MPHRVASFFRSSTNSLENQISSLKKGSHNNNTENTHTRHSRSPHPRSTDRTPDATSIHEGSEEMHPPPGKMADKHESHGDSHHRDHHSHRLSFPGFVHIGRTSKESHTNQGASLDIKIESPPIVFHGDAENSSGALVSGQLFLDIKEDGLMMDSFTAVLNIHVTQKRPFATHCHDCTHQYTELQSWAFLKVPLAMTKGVHQFPFSVLMGGHLPASLDGPLMSIAYEFKAEAAPRQGYGSPIKLEKIFNVKRSLPTHETPHHSVRVFPPTNIKTSVHFPQVIHPTGTNTLTLRMDGIASSSEKNGTIEFWKLKKLTWRLEETAKTVAPACEKHSPKDQRNPATVKKGLQRTDIRVIGEKTLFSGWKSNYDSTESAVVEMELEYGVGKDFAGADSDTASISNNSSSKSSSKDKKRYACDAKSSDGSEVTHQLMLELVVSQEWAPASRPAMVTQTGIGRILRMHFLTVLTERAGIGISWDNEAPPIYQDVPPSPPAYCGEIVAAAAMAGLVLEDVEVEHMDLNPSSPSASISSIPAPGPDEAPPAWTATSPDGVLGESR